MALKIAGNDSFKMKNIADLQQLDTLPSSANVIVEHGGFAKRFDASKLEGKVKTVNGIEPDENGNIEVEAGGSVEQVQPDWTQNDPAQPDYVKNRTHWVEGEKTVIEWDGNTEGRDSFSVSGTTVYKISDETPTTTDLTGGTLQVDDSPDGALTETSFYEVEGGFSIAGNVIVVQSADTFAFAAPSTGVYAAPCSTLTLTYGSTTYHPLDEAFIPDTIARKTDVTWENLPDKPFGEEQTVIEWDFNTEGLESVVGGSLTFYKMSDTIIDLNDYESIVVELKAPNGTTESSQVAEDNIIRDNGAIGQGQVVHTVSGMQLHVVYMPSGGGTMQDVEFTSGQWIASSNADFSTVPSGAFIKFTYGSTKTIDPKFLPEGGFGWEGESVELCAATDITFSAQDGFYGGILDAVWDVTPGEKVIVGWDGTEYECIAIAQESFILLGNGSIMGLEGNYCGEPFAIQVYLGEEVAILTNDSSASHSVSAYKDAEIHTIDPKFLPKASTVPDAVGETVTAAEFNALLAALREAGYLAT